MSKATGERGTLVVVALLVSAAVLIWAQSGDNELMADHAQAPDFTLTLVDGSTVRSADLKGKVVLLDFWASWCPPCREELPYLVKIAHEREADGVVLLAVSQDAPRDVPRIAQAFAQSIPGFERHVARGDDLLTDRFYVEALPTLYVINRKGQVIASRQGLASERTVRKWVDEALEE